MFGRACHAPPNFQMSDRQAVNSETHLNTKERFGPFHLPRSSIFLIMERKDIDGLDDLEMARTR
jgi:hypothetical protein